MSFTPNKGIPVLPVSLRPPSTGKRAWWIYLLSHMYKKAKTSTDYFQNVPEIILLKTANYADRSLVESVFSLLVFKSWDIKSLQWIIFMSRDSQRVVFDLLLLKQYQKRTICQSASNHRVGLMYIPKISFITGDLWTEIKHYVFFY